MDTTLVSRRAVARPQHNVTKRPSFGCRLLVVASGGPMSAGDVLGPAVTWRNSFRRQSEERSPSWFNKLFFCDDPGSGHPNPDGWGFLGLFNKPGTSASDETAGKTVWQIKKRPTQASKDWHYLKSIGQMALNHPYYLVGHLREKSDAFAPSRDNTHPFQVTLPVSSKGEKVSVFLSHNGSSNAMNSPQVKKALASLAKARPDLAPKGTTDSERILLLMLEKVREKHGDLNASVLTEENLRDAMAETIFELNGLSTSFQLPVREKGAVSGETKEVKPGFNFVLTMVKEVPDKAKPGETRQEVLSLVSRWGRSLYQTRQKTANGQEIQLFASEKMHPRDSKLQWEEVPEGGVYTLRRDSRTGTLNISETSVQAILEHKNPFRQSSLAPGDWEPARHPGFFSGGGSSAPTLHFLQSSRFTHRE